MHGTWLPAPPALAPAAPLPAIRFRISTALSEIFTRTVARQVTGAFLPREERR